jgi:hypothetical protein
MYMTDLDNALSTAAVLFFDQNYSRINRGISAPERQLLALRVTHRVVVGGATRRRSYLRFYDSTVGNSLVLSSSPEARTHLELLYAKMRNYYGPIDGRFVVTDAKPGLADLNTFDRLYKTYRNVLSYNGGSYANWPNVMRELSLYAYHVSLGGLPLVMDGRWLEDLVLTADRNRKRMTELRSLRDELRQQERLKREASREQPESEPVADPPEEPSDGLVRMQFRMPNEFRVESVSSSSTQPTWAIYNDAPVDVRARFTECRLCGEPKITNDVCGVCGRNPR